MNGRRNYLLYFMNNRIANAGISAISFPLPASFIMTPDTNIDYRKSIQTKRLQIKPSWLEYLDSAVFQYIGRRTINHHLFFTELLNNLTSVGNIDYRYFGKPIPLTKTLKNSSHATSPHCFFSFSKF
jgi:hypothetical protein